MLFSAKFFVHAFAQFRWGVFQEYAEEGENVFYMSPSAGQPEAIRCTFLIRGLVQKNDAAHTICYSRTFILYKPGNFQKINYIVLSFALLQTILYVYHANKMPGFYMYLFV